MLPTTLARLAAERAGVVLTSEAVEHGLNKVQLDALCRSGAWIRLARGVYLLRSWLAVDGVSVLQRAWAAVLLSGSTAVVIGAAAWELHGLAGAQRWSLVDVAVAGCPTRKQPPDRHLSWATVCPEDVIVVEGVRVLSVCALLNAASRTQSREVFVSMLDSALHHHRVSETELEKLRHTVAARARSWVDLGDGRAESPLETRVRLILIDAGLAPDDVNHRVEVRDRVVARIDLVWFRPGLKLALEADGEGPHGQPGPLFKDRTRQTMLTGLGWTVVRCTWDDAVRRPQWIVQQVLLHLSGAVAGLTR